MADDTFVEVKLLFTLVVNEVEQPIYLNVEMRKSVVDSGLDNKVKIRDLTVIVD